MEPVSTVSVLERVDCNFQDDNSNFHHIGGALWLKAECGTWPGGSGVWGGMGTGVGGGMTKHFLKSTYQ